MAIKVCNLIWDLGDIWRSERFPIMHDIFIHLALSQFPISRQPKKNPRTPQQSSLIRFDSTSAGVFDATLVFLVVLGLLSVPVQHSVPVPEATD